MLVAFRGKKEKTVIKALFIYLVYSFVVLIIFIAKFININLI